ncbi:DUF6141 family protein [Halococcus sp. IIIV-5B]|uniref:DUF6141 family protein n=1 Tax=Halococcus sp. IIIV-5B TaxID=2321230 RepID=UPI0011C3F3F2|nr:DUF6141 family protein [Halococcus sp. IIIV-5B]
MAEEVALDGEDEVITFREVQRVRTWSVWAAALLVTGLTAVLAAPTVVIPLTVMMVLFLQQNTTEVRDDGVYVRSRSLRNSFQQIPFSDIERCEIRDVGLFGDKKDSVWESLRSKAYTLNTGKGVKLYRKSGKPVLIGTDRPDELMEAITQ